MSYLKTFFQEILAEVQEIIVETSKSEVILQENPDYTKNFFQNYADHLYLLEYEFAKELNEILKGDIHLSEKLIEMFELLCDLKHLLILDALRDGHDYMDEFVLGISIVPLTSIVTSLVCFVSAIWQGAIKLAIKTGFKENDQEPYGYQALGYLAASAFALMMAIGSFLKSFISLFSRPIVTMIQGWKQQETNRFCHENVTCNI